MPLSLEATIVTGMYICMSVSSFDSAIRADVAEQIHHCVHDSCTCPRYWLMMPACCDLLLFHCFVCGWMSLEHPHARDYGDCYAVLEIECSLRLQ